MNKTGWLKSLPRGGERQGGSRVVDLLSKQWHVEGEGRRD